MVENCTYIGSYRLGDHVPLQCVCIAPGGTNALPDVSPVASIYAPGGSKVDLVMPVMDLYGKRGLFSFDLMLDSRFGTGLHRILYSFALGGLPYRTMSMFDVVSSGDAGGALISMTNYTTPQAVFIVGQLSSGRLVAGRGPSI